MPKSKRDRLVSLTKVKKKTRAWKEGLIKAVQKLVDEYPSVYILRYQNMRNDKFKELREDLRDSSRFYFGSSKVMKKALGSTKEEEYLEGLAEISEVLRSTVGLLFTRLSQEEVLQKFDTWEHVDYARAGSRASQDFSLLAGPLENDEGPIAHTLEPFLRKHKLPVKLTRGIVELIEDHTVCKKGQFLTPDQAAILKVFHVRMSKFRFTPIAQWNKSSGGVEMLVDDITGNDDPSDDEMEEMLDEFGGVPVPGIPTSL